jgi:N-acetylmuramoyl-L-alanine amidase
MVRAGHLLFWILLLFCAIARAGDWTVVTYGGRDYVTMRNVSDFYGLDGYHEIDKTVEMGAPGRMLRASIGSNEFYINNLKFVLSYPVENVNDQAIVSRMDLTKIIEPVLRPSRIHNAATIDSIVLDPGHGGYDNGAMSLWGNEKNYALDVAWRTKPLLEAMGLHVFMTRTDDEFIPLEERVRFANQHPTALFIAIHFNAGDPDANGIETYTLAPRGVPSMAASGPMLTDFVQNPGNVCDSENMALACATHASMISHLRLFDRGIKRARFVVIRDIAIPGVLVEGGFLTNPNDARLIATAQYREEEAQCIALAVRNYRNAVNLTSQSYAMDGHGVNLRDDGAEPPPSPQPDDTPVGRGYTPPAQTTAAPSALPSPQWKPAPSDSAKPSNAPAPQSTPAQPPHTVTGGSSMVTPILD